MHPNPFNPGSPVDPNEFVGRTNELENFRQKLRQTMSGSLASMAVAGGYGVGKTSFLHKCKAIAEEQNALTIYFSLNELDELTRETLAQELIERVKEKVKEEVILRKLTEKVLSILSWIKIKASQVEVSVSKPETEANSTLQSALSAAWGALKSHKSAIVFLIDEARALEKKRADLILYLRAILEQLQTEKVPVMIIPAGKLTISGPSGTGFSPLVRTFQPVILENFTIEETKSFVVKRLKIAEINIQDEIIHRIFQVTEGHPFVVSAYLKTAYSKLQSEETELKESHLEATDIGFVNTDLKHFFSRFFDHSTTIKNRILAEIASSPHGESTLSEISEKIGKELNKISPHLGNLVQEGSIIRIDRGRYKLFHHLFGEYILKNNFFS